MSQGMNTALQLSGEEHTTGSTTYSLEQYLGSQGAVTERLLGGLNIGDIVSRAQATKGQVDELADRIAQTTRVAS